MCAAYVVRCLLQAEYAARAVRRKGKDLILSVVGDALLEVHVLVRDEKEGRKKQARSNKQQGKATQHTQGSHFS